MTPMLSRGRTDETNERTPKITHPQAVSPAIIHPSGLKKPRPKPQRKKKSAATMARQPGFAQS